jgi:uncharacterized protein YecE (DUF72 family)
VSVHIGTSGWHYSHWRGGFYPPSLPTREWLAYYGQRFATVEVNNAFYRLPEASAFGNWAAAVPDDFVMAVKASRYLTHIRRLRNPDEPVRLLRARMTGLGPKLGPVLLQLPPNLTIDLSSLDTTLTSFAGIRVAVEFRHQSWFIPETRRLLEEHQAALCLTDSGGRRTPLWRTAGWGYVRFHGGRAQPESCYGRAALQTWAGQLAELWPDSADLYAYFNNDRHGCAPRDARLFAAAVERVGLVPTRVPSTRQTPLSPASELPASATRPPETVPEPG